MNNTPLRITDTTLRDAHQSLWATRMSIEDILPIAEKLDQVGYHSVEVWGGATFDVCLRYMEEDPWDRLKKIRGKITKTPLQMLLRGQNLVGYKNYPDDLVEAFIRKAVDGGVKIFRVFDALNDIRNLEKTISILKKYNVSAQGSICYTRSPIHTIDAYVKFGKQLVDAGVDCINIKDMSGILTPFDAYDLVKALKTETKKLVQLHCHSSSGMATAAYVKAIEAGVDVVDCAAAPLALYTSQPAVETLIAMMSSTTRATKLNFDLVHRISEYWEDVSEKRRLHRNNQSLIDVSVIEHQIPGGMVSNLIVQLEQQKALGKFEEVLLEVPKVRKDIGWPPLVTPMSQIVGSQAVFNVITGKRYKVVPKEIKDYIKGYYGKPPGKIDPKIKKLLGSEINPITCRPADLLEPIMEKAEKALQEKGLKQKEEDTITYALFPEVAVPFFENRKKNKGKKKETNKETTDSFSHISGIVKSISGTSVTDVVIENKERKIAIKRTMSAQKKPPVTLDGPPMVKTISEESEDSQYEKILSKMVGVFYFGKNGNNYRSGDVIEEGQVIGILEAMRVKNEIISDFKCRLIDNLVSDQDPIEYAQPLFLVEPL